MKDQVILVDENDSALGAMEKFEAHKKGLLHRAFSIFIFNTQGELLLQKRAKKKYHSGGLWTNTCCSHPYPGEEIKAAAERRLKEEMGISCKLIFAFHFLYKASLDNGFTEHEFDHVFYGISDEPPNLNSSEVEDFKYKNLNKIRLDIETSPSIYTSWFRVCFNEVCLKILPKIEK